MTATEQMVRHALALGRLARGFKYPDKAFRDALAQGAYQAELLDVLGAVKGDGDWAEALSQLRQALQQATSDPAALEGEHTYLFARNVVSSPYGASYGGDRIQGILELASFYAAFGFKVAPGGEPPDHVGAELEFLAVLYAKEAYAREQGWTEQAEICLSARKKFVTEQLGQWLAAFAQRVQEQARHPFYPALAIVARRMVETELEGEE
ncbi:MAG: molecular chaperone TorD family protein [Chloroflexota bacterium]|nr:molecular chaperone TorD family protein [Chloroflexota bacterium]